MLKENPKTLFKIRLIKAKMEFARLDCFIKKKHAKILLLQHISLKALDLTKWLFTRKDSGGGLRAGAKIVT